MNYVKIKTNFTSHWSSSIMICFPIKIFQDVSVGSSKEKMKEAGAQERASIGTSGEEQRKSNFFCG